MNKNSKSLFYELSEALTKLQALPVTHIEQQVFPELCRLCNVETMLVFQSVPGENWAKRILGYSHDMLHPLMQMFRFERMSHLCYRPCLIKDNITNPEVRATLLKQGDVSFFIYPVHLENAGTVFFYFSSKDKKHRWNESILAVVSKTVALRLWGEEEKKARQNDSFLLSTASHETRTQLAAFLALTESLENKNLPKDALADVGLLQKTAENMLQTLNGILDYGKIKSGRMRLNPVAFNIGECIKSIVEIFTPLAQKNGVSLSCDLSGLSAPTINMDPVLIKQVIFNLLNNAVKVAPNGSIRLTVSSDDDKRLISVAVADTGPGIPEDIKDTLFDAYVQADPMKSKGTGLGLAISKNIISFLGGTIRADNAPEGGAVFSFSIPYEPAAQKDTATLPLNILLIDDDQMSLKLTEAYLIKLNHHVSLANSAEKGLDMLKRHNYDVAFADIHLTDLDALELLEKIREIPNRNGMPVYAYTASGDPKERDACLKAGFSGVLIKPLPKDVFKNILDQIGILKKFRFSDSPLENSSFDLKTLIEFKDAIDPEQFENLVSEYLLHSYTLFNEINRAFMANNPSDLYRFAHNLKSASKTFGLKLLSKCAERIEKIGKSGIIPAEKTAKDIKLLEKEYKKSTMLLQQYIQENK